MSKNAKFAVKGGYVTLQQFDDLRRMLDERHQTTIKNVEVAFAAAERAVNTAMIAQEKANLKTETAYEKRFESVNEFRGQLADQAAMLMTRAEADAKFASLVEKVEALTGRINVGTGRSAGLSQGWGFLVGAVGVIAAAVGVVIGLQ